MQINPHNTTPYIAKDTKQPLVVMGCYRINSDGGIIRDRIISRPKPTANDNDVGLLKKHGKAGLENMQLYGAIDRLQTSGLI